MTHTNCKGTILLASGPVPCPTCRPRAYHADRMAYQFSGAKLSRHNHPLQSTGCASYGVAVAEDAGAVAGAAHGQTSSKI